jgi:hypothetical protein
VKPDKPNYCTSYDPKSGNRATITWRGDRCTVFFDLSSNDFPETLLEGSIRALVKLYGIENDWTLNKLTTEILRHRVDDSGCTDNFCRNCGTKLK